MSSIKTNKTKDGVEFEVVIDDFSVMTPSQVRFSPKTPHYLIAGVDPGYFLNIDPTGASTPTQQFVKSPLVSGTSLASVITSLDVNATYVRPNTQWLSMIPGGIGTGYSDGAYFLSNNAHLYQRNYGLSTFSDWGVPTPWTGLNPTRGGMDIFAGSLVIVNNASGSPVRRILSTGVESTLSTLYANAIDVKRFLNYCMALSSDANGCYVQKIDTSFNVGTTANGLSIGAGFNGYKLENYIDKYLAVFAGRVTGPRKIGGSKTYCFLWDGVSLTYNYAIPVPGNYIDSLVTRDGTLVVLVSENFGTAGGATAQSVPNQSLYYLKGLQFVRLETLPQYVSPNFNSLFAYDSFVGIISGYAQPNNYGNIILRGGFDFGGINVVTDYLYPLNSTFPTFGRAVQGSDGILDVGNGSQILEWGTSKKTIYYLSNVIDFDVSANLKSVEVFYDSPPGDNTDNIIITAYGESDRAASGSAANISNSFTLTKSNYVFPKSTMVPLPLNFDRMYLKLSAENSTWRTNLRKVILRGTINEL